MRTIVLLLFALGSYSLGSAQEESPPTQQEIQAQKQQAIAKAKKTREETKAKLALAKANNEGPEKIKQIEGRLASLDQMIAMLDKTDLTDNKTPKPLPPSKNTEPEYVSPFIPIKLKQPVKIPGEGQATDQLLWYTGRRIDDNTLITTRGMIVQYDRNNHGVTVQPDRRIDSPYYFLENSVARTKRMKNEFAADVGGIMNSFFMWPAILDAYKEFDIQKTRYYDLAKNRISWPLPGHGGLQTRWEELLEAERNLQTLSIVPPPTRPDLCACATQARDAYETALNGWLEEFWGKEDKLFEEYRRMYWFLDAFPESRSVLARTPNINGDIKRALNTVIERKGKKLLQLFDDYENDNMNVEHGLVLAAVSFNQQLTEEIHAVDEDTKILKSTAQTLIERIKRLVLSNRVYDKYIEQQKESRNYNAVFDFSFYMEHEIDKTRLNDSYQVPNAKKWYESLKKFNRFTLSLNIDFEFQLGDENNPQIVMMKADGKLESDNMTVSLGQRGCKWEFFVTDQNYEKMNTSGEEFKIPIKILNGTKIWFISKPPKVISYTGPSYFRMVFPSVRINFCENSPDSIVLQVLSYKKAETEAHVNDDTKKVYTTDMIGYANKMFIGIEKSHTNVNELISTAGEMMNIRSSELPPSTGNPVLDRIMMEYKMNQKRIDLQYKLALQSHTEKTVIQFDAVNGAEAFNITTHSTVDATDKDRPMGINLTRGSITVRIQHSPQ
jgi:hypothetical protein